MECPKCGTENSPHARFCQQCGFDIKSVPAGKSEQPIIQPVPSGEIPTAPSQAASNPAVNPANPVQLEEIVIPMPPVIFPMPISLPYAGFWLRVAASLIDGLILSGVAFIVFLPVGIIMGILGVTTQLPQSSINATMGLFSFIADAVGAVLSWLYYALMESSSRQATVGKMAVGIKVVSLDGNRISFGRATARYFAKIINAFTLGFGYLTIAFTEKKQGIHDMISGTLVIKK